jgi:hypothetical protein
MLSVPNVTEKKSTTEPGWRRDNVTGKQQSFYYALPLAAGSLEPDYATLGTPYQEDKRIE